MKPSDPATPANRPPPTRTETKQNDPPENTAASSGLRTQSLHDEITRVARDLWQRYGRPEGRDDEIRREAERQVLGADPDVARVSGGSVSASDLKQANAAPLDKDDPPAERTRTPKK